MQRMSCLFGGQKMDEKKNFEIVVDDGSVEVPIYNTLNEQIGLISDKLTLIDSQSGCSDFARLTSTLSRDIEKLLRNSVM